MKEDIPEEVRRIFREYGKKGGRKIRDPNDEKAQKNRERVQRHRDKKRGEQDERSAQELSQHDAD